MISFFVFLFCLFVTYGSYLLLTRKSTAQRAQMNRRLADLLLLPSADPNDKHINLAKEEVLSGIPVLDEWLKQVEVASRLKALIAQADLQITVTQLCMFSGLAGLSAWLAAAALSNSVFIGFCGGGLAAAAPFMHVTWKRKQRLHQFLMGLPDALELLSRALGAGHSFPESLQVVAAEIPDPLATEFRRTYEEQQLGLSLNVALENLSQRMPLLDLQICVTAVLIQREMGGNVVEILGKVADTLRDRFRILEDLKTLTTSSRISAWVLCGIPLAVAVIESVINPEYMSAMWHDPLGQKLVALAIVLQLMGMLLVQRILRINI